MNSKVVKILIAIMVASLNTAMADDRAVFPDAIIFHAAKSSQVINSLRHTRSVKLLGPQSTARSISPFAYRVEVPIAGFSKETLTPHQYAAALNPCRRARARSFMKNLGVRARCSPNWAMHADAITPNDQYARSQWAINKLQLPDAWQTTQGSSQVVVGVVDSGITFGHPDLVQNIWTNPGEIPGDGIDNDHNGYIDDVHGWNAITNAGNPDDDNGHGTHVAGIIGASGNNGIGVAGVAWKVGIMPLKFLNSQGSGSLSDAMECLEYARVMKARGVNIVATNNSWGGPGSITSFLTSTLETLSNSGMLFIAAAGNSSLNNDLTAVLPGNIPSTNMITVASVNPDNTLSSFSNFGLLKVHIAAPGSDILSTYPGEGTSPGRYVSLNGTSMAAPQVSGVAALIASLGPLSAAQRRSIILSTGTVVNGLSSKISSSSIVNAKGAVSAAFTMLGGVATPTIAPTKVPTVAVIPTPGTKGVPSPTATPLPHSPPTATLSFELRSKGPLKVGGNASLVIKGSTHFIAQITVGLTPLKGRAMNCPKRINIPLNYTGAGSLRVLLSPKLSSFSKATLTWKTGSGPIQREILVNPKSRRKVSSQQLSSDLAAVCRGFKTGE